MLRTLATVFDLLAALREGDYGMRGRVRAAYDPLQALIADINGVSDQLRSGRRKRTETSRFVGKTMIALQNPVFVLDQERRLLLINPAARHLMGAERRAVVGRAPQELGLDELLSSADGSIVPWHFATASGRWAVRRAVWYSEGRQHTLVMLHDVTAALGQEERTAWQRLIRVLSHELNNSLTPIGSLADSLGTLMAKDGPVAARDELREGLEVIGRRSGSLLRFLSGYGRLARLPPLHMRAFRLDLAIERLVRLERRLPVVIRHGPVVSIVGDEDQLDQAFLNLLRNAVEASLPSGGGVRVDWRVEGARMRIEIEDDGMGLPRSGGLFVPFFTTKPDGSGIGLSLTRLIVEAHSGTVELADRTDARGAVATVRLPLGSL